MSERPSDRWVAGFLAILVHAGIVVLLGWGWWHFRKPVAAVSVLPIEATVVTESATRAPAPAASPAVPSPATPPPPAPPVPTAARASDKTRELAQRQREQAAAQQREQAEQAHAQREREAHEQAQRQREAQEAAQRAAAEREAADKAAKLKAQQEADKARREAELHNQLAAEERVNAARGSADMVAYLSLITARINRAWIRPASARAGVSCVLHVTQVPGGEVTGVQIASCNGDQAVRESIEAAVYRASPLPSPSNPDVFDRNLTIRFHPDE